MLLWQRPQGPLRALALGVVLILGLAACSRSDSGSADATSASTASTAVASAAAATTATGSPAPGPSSEPEPPPSAPLSHSAELTADRPYNVFVPTEYDAAVPMPLVLLLHGYTASGEIQEAYFEFEPLAESLGFLYVRPDGTIDARGQQFWNATNACCGFGGDAPDDASYLMAIIEQVSATYNVDPKAIFLAGHSNGGFMSYRMACDHADTIAGIASLAGATMADAAQCAPSEPVSVLQVHGTNDNTIVYGGGSILGNRYPSATDTVASWATYNDCDTTPSIVTGALDLDGSIEGAESRVEAFGNCARGASVELWSIEGGSHIPAVTAEFSASVVDFLLAHPKP